MVCRIQWIDFHATYRVNARRLVHRAMVHRAMVHRSSSSRCLGRIAQRIGFELLTTVVGTEVVVDVVILGEGGSIIDSHLHATHGIDGVSDSTAKTITNLG